MSQPAMDTSFGSGVNYGAQLGANHGSITNNFNNYIGSNGEPSWSSGNIHWTVTRPLNALFTGRSDILQRIQDTIQARLVNSTLLETCRIVVTGMGGQGKSEVCLRIANNLRHHFWGVFWVDVSKADQAKQHFLTIAKQLGQAADSIEEVKQLLANVAHPSLLILDNAEDLDFDYQQYITTSTRVFILLTSRNEECSQYGTAGHEHLDGLNNDDAQALLFKACRTPDDQRPSDESHARTVCELLGSHPLALIQAGSYIAQQHCTLEMYPELYRLNRQRLLQFHPRQSQSRYQNVFATFEASIETLQSSLDDNAQNAMELLSVLSMLDSSYLALSTFEIAWGKAQKHSSKTSESVDGYGLCSWHVDQSLSLIRQLKWDSFLLTTAIHMLQSLALVSVTSRAGSIGLFMHPLTHAWARERQGRETEDRSWMAAGSFLAFFSRDMSMQTLTSLEMLRPHILALFRRRIIDIYGGQPRTVITQLLIALMWTFNHLQLDSQLHLMFMDIFSILKLQPFQVDRKWLPLYQLFEENLYSLERYGQAVEIAEQTLDILQQARIATDPILLAQRRGLASSCLQIGQTERAIAMLEEVVSACMRTMRADDHPVRVSRHELARAYLRNKQNDQAIVILEDLVAVESRILAHDANSRLESMRLLASAYRRHGHPKRTISILERVVEIERLLAIDSRQRLGSQKSLAKAYRDDGQLEKAIAILEGIVPVRRTMPVDHPSRSSLMKLLGRLYVARGQVKEATAVLEEVVHALPIDDPSRVRVMYDLSRAYLDAGRVKEGTILLEDRVRIRENLPIDDLSRLTSMHDLAIAFMDNGRAREAITILEKVVQARQASPIDDSQLIFMHDLGKAYNDLEQVKEAVAILKEVVQAEKSLPLQDSSRLSSMYELGKAYAGDGQLKEAVKLLEEVVQGEMVLPRDDSDRLTSMHLLGKVYMDNGQIKEAVVMLQEVVQWKQTLPKEHSSRIKSEVVLAKAMWKDGQRRKAFDLLAMVVEILRSDSKEAPPEFTDFVTTLAEYSSYLDQQENGNESAMESKDTVDHLTQQFNRRVTRNMLRRVEQAKPEQKRRASQRLHRGRSRLRSGRLDS